LEIFRAGAAIGVPDAFQPRGESREWLAMSGPRGKLSGQGSCYQTKIFARSFAAIFGEETGVFEANDPSPVGGVHGFTEIAASGGFP
jgi:hypothetical protein